MRFCLVVSNNNYDGDNFASHYIKNEDENHLKELIAEFNGFEEASIDTALLYSVATDKAHSNVIIAKVKCFEQTYGGVRIHFEQKTKLEQTCLNIRNRLYATKCRLGWKDERGLYVVLLSEEDFNTVAYPEEKRKKYTSLYAKLSELKAKNRWVEMIREFGDLSKFEENFNDIWNDAQDLDQYVVYPLSHLSTPGDKYRLRSEMLPYFLKFSDRVLELYPTNISALSVRAYFHYNNYIAVKSKHEEDDFKMAEKHLIDILEINPEHIPSIYRLAKLYQAYLEQIRFIAGVDRRPYYSKIISSYENVIEIFERDRTALSRHNYEYQSSIYNLLKLFQDYLLNVERTYFEFKIFERNIDFLLNKEKEDKIEETLTLALKLQEEGKFSLDTPAEEMIDEGEKDQIDILYRTAISYQSKALFLDLVNNKEQITALAQTSNQYVKKAFDVFYARSKRNIRCRKPNYLYKVQALNDYLMGNKQKAYDSLQKGQSDSIYRLGELYFLEGKLSEAETELQKIGHNDRLNMYDKAQKLLLRIEDVRKN